MAELKTKLNELSVNDFLNAIQDEVKRRDSYAILALLQRLSGKEPKMWGTSIVGFGSYHYKYESGHEGDAPELAFSPRKQNLTIYGMEVLLDHPDLTAKLGKFKTGKGCLYVNKLSDIDLAILEEIIRRKIAA